MMYIIAFSDEAQAQQLLEPYGYAHLLPPSPDPHIVSENSGYAWNQGNAMIGGAKLITGYADTTDDFGNPARVPIYHDTSAFWASLLSYDPDEELWEGFSDHPMIELDFTRIPGDPVIPSDYVVREVNFPLDINTLKGITPIWAGAPDMGFPYDNPA